MNALNIEIYSDLICPWCYIGKRRMTYPVILPASLENVHGVVGDPGPAAAGAFLAGSTAVSWTTCAFLRRLMYRQSLILQHALTLRCPIWTSHASQRAIDTLTTRIYACRHGVAAMA
jgi:hypothetical protein